MATVGDHTLSFDLGLYILKLHDPRDYVYSDMQIYMSLAKRLVDPEYVLGAQDVTHPAATSTLFSWFLSWDPGLQSLVYLPLMVACLVPLALGLLGRVAFERKTGLWAIVASSLYFPYIDYGGYFLSEIYMMLPVPLCMSLYLMANQAARAWTRILFGIGAGLILFLAVSFKTVALVLVGFAMLHLLLSSAPERRIRLVAFGLMLSGGTPGGAFLV